MADVAANLAVVQQKIADAAARSERSPDAVRFVLVTKTVAAERVLEAVRAGATDLGENKVQEGRRKAEALCATQGFALGENVLAVQFHPEVDACAGIEHWLIGHACELAAAGVDPRVIREDAKRRGPALREAGRAMFGAWLEGLTF